MKPLVSILIPSYNASQYIAETLESAVAQTWPNKEILVMDDGSSDDTVTIAKRFEAGGVVVDTQKNQGAAATRNNLFAKSRGEYIQWLDADDLLGTDKIERQLSAVEANDRRVLLSSPWGSFSYRPKQAKFVSSALCETINPAEWLIRKLSQNLHMQTATWLTSRELIEAAGPWDTRLLSDDDGEFYCRVLRACKEVRFVPEGRVYYRVTPSSRLSYIGLSDRKKDAMVISMKLHVGYLLSMEDSPRARAACLTYLHNWLANFFPERMDLVEELREVARDLGGQLSLPTLGWKYSWIQKLFGWTTAKRVQMQYNQWKSALLLGVDKMLFRLQRNA